MMAKDEKREIKEGTVTETLKGAMFRVLLDGHSIKAQDHGEQKSNHDNETTVLANISGKMRLHYIRVLVGDRVQVQMDPYDPHRGRVIKRL